MWRRVCLSSTAASTSVVDDIVTFARQASKVLLIVLYILFMLKCDWMVLGLRVLDVFLSSPLECQGHYGSIFCVGRI